MQTKPSSLVWFTILVFAFSIPFWVLGNVFQFELMPGLPISSLAAFTPTMAALVIAYRGGKLAAVGGLLRRAFDAKRVRDWRWYLIFVLFNPAVAVAAFWAMRVAGTPAPNPPALTLAVVPMSIMFFLAALGEEIGWTGYATGPLLRRQGILTTGLLLGVVWVVFHFVMLAQVERSLEWIAWWSLSTLVLRTFMVWLYQYGGGSVFAAALFHTMINVSWQLFPINGSFYDPRIFSLVTLALAVVIIGARRVTLSAEVTPAL